MDDQTKQLIEGIKNNPAAIQSLFRTQDGQNLLRMLTAGDNGATLQRAAKNASKGDPSEMIQMVSRIMQSPDGAALVDRIGKNIKR
ncbi:MAG: hypothetical protein LKJ86_01685 [Oscillibacter sp.]|jgi:hypothetical protein|nr:hypothetical protein [Oscillibacter sp.]